MRISDERLEHYRTHGYAIVNSFPIAIAGVNARCPGMDTTPYREQS
ncbi:MAG: hypothetical protein P8J55_00120 [Pseudomonadales bacterium]|nr:hypothetical protein [Pseudomonadales bacterium]